MIIRSLYLDNVTLNEWSAGPSQTVLLYVPVGVSPILNYGVRNCMEQPFE